MVSQEKRPVPVWWILLLSAVTAEPVSMNWPLNRHASDKYIAVEFVHDFVVKNRRNLLIENHFLVVAVIHGIEIFEKKHGRKDIYSTLPTGKEILSFIKVCNLEPVH
ncbi:MAG: hypothetical protein AB7D05_10870 [Mangrovibacterium sp.]